MIKLTSSGSFKRTRKFLNKVDEITHFHFLDKYGRQGVEALQASTPKDTGLTANSWYYEIRHLVSNDGRSIVELIFNNSNVVRGRNGKSYPIAIILQYGHGTRNGGYVQGIDYINPSLRPVFENILKHAWEEVKSV